MTGKLANTVMVVRNGVQIARAYQPVVSNPRTPAQVASRARLKMLSQLAAVLAPAIAIPRSGNVSSRNFFTKINYPFSEFTNNQASITLSSVQLTKSVVGLPQVNATRGVEKINVYISSLQGYQALSRVVYVMLAKQTDGNLRYAGSIVANQSGSGNFEAELPLTPEECVIYAYGVRDNTESASIRFGNLEAETAETIAKLIVTSALSESDITVTETRGITLNAANRADTEQSTVTKKKPVKEVQVNEVQD